MGIHAGSNDLDRGAVGGAVDKSAAASSDSTTSLESCVGDVMVALLAIIFVAVIVLVLTKPERTRPLGLLATGLLSIVLGGRAVALLSDSYSDSISAVAAAQDVAAQNVVAADQDAEDSTTTSANEPARQTSQTPEKEHDAEVSDDAEQPEPPATPPPASPPPESKAASNGEAAVGTLAVEPVARVKYLTKRPDWVGKKPFREGDIDKLPVASGYEVRQQSADRALLDALKQHFDRYINEHVGSKYAATLVGYSIHETRDGGDRIFQLVIDDRFFQIGKNPFEELVEFEFGVMHQSHLLVSIDGDVRSEIDRRWREIRATSRLLQTALGAGVVLMLLGTVFGYFKLDTATRGYYTGRLQFGTAATILALVAVCVLLAKWIHWM